ncbi:DsbE family thiol:disulfide interchange protein [Aurantiacibacter aquimixticola]|uniref:DsbE family thiol:disulfide interchange protein n=1 Tax=Aurantiacibacter aquimixticola TaxID=1958945 RepID=A0A419RRH1_9SPHN|nr:DsbE family thiol:disulfide interchange protein [Aurantiacibacter aquimixticola]RJY08354.1 DsbE family thiol:disulfide interchange protein [Aurantiacibacter aquimixticola]
MKRVRIILWIAVALAGLLFGLLAYQLQQPKNDFVKSALVGQQMPTFALPPIVEARPGLSSANLADGTPKLLNIFASWCVPCAAEAPYLDQLEQQGAQIVAVAIRDRPEDVNRFLQQHGNPFTRIGSDEISEVQLALGSSGVPETFVVAGDGTITYQHIGDIRADDVPMLLEELRKAGE